MTIFDELPSGVLASKAPPGYRPCQRAIDPSAERDTMDAAVEAAGGYIDGEVLTSEGQRPNKLMATRYDVSWYAIPEDRFDRQ